MHKLIIIICFLKISSFGFSQKAAFSAGLQLPLKYDIGFEYKLHKKISTNLNFGILTKPFDESILGILKIFGLEQGYVDMIGNAFEFGLVSDLGFRFHHKKNYFGVFVQNIYLLAKIHLKI